MKPTEIKNLEETLSRFSAITKKNAQKIALSIIESDEIVINNLVDNLKIAQTKIKKCRDCGVLSSGYVCQVCKDPKRSNTLMIVSTSFDCWHIEEMGIYNGKYHILDGEIIESKRVFYKDLNTDLLKDKVSHFKEIIIATNPTIHGQITAEKIQYELREFSDKISQLAVGLPIGSKIDYIDNLTFSMALKNRNRNRYE